jgi:hypothetical protein
MTYHQMRLLFAGLARYDGRLSVLTARSEGPDRMWTVVLRDHVRDTWLRLRRIEQLIPDEGPPRRDAARPAGMKRAACAIVERGGRAGVVGF